LFFYMTVVPKPSFLYTFCTLFTIILTNLGENNTGSSNVKIPKFGASAP